MYFSCILSPALPIILPKCSNLSTCSNSHIPIFLFPVIFSLLFSLFLFFFCIYLFILSPISFTSHIIVDSISLIFFLCLIRTAMSSAYAITCYLIVTFFSIFLSIYSDVKKCSWRCVSWFHFIVNLSLLLSFSRLFLLLSFSYRLT